MSTQILFNQFAYADRLKAGGFTDAQARASVEALGVALSESVATSHDLAAVEQRLDAKIDAVEQRLDAKIDAVEQRLDAKIDAVDHKLDAVEQRLSAKIDKSVSDLKLEIAQANNKMLIKTGGMLSFIVVAAMGAAKYFDIIH